MAERIVVINPNSSAAVTAAIDRAVAPLRMAGGPEIDCVTLSEGPPGIESQAHVEQVVQPLCRLVGEHADAAAFVIACFSDPGLQLCREATDRPVLGIAECGLLTALTRGERCGILAILRTSVPRHLRYVRQLGLSERFAGDLPLGLGVAELADRERTLAAHAGGRRRPARSPRRRCPRARLRRHGRLPGPARGSPRRAGDRPDAGRSHDGARRGAARGLVTLSDQNAAEKRCHQLKIAITRQQVMVVLGAERSDQYVDAGARGDALSTQTPVVPRRCAGPRRASRT